MKAQFWAVLAVISHPLWLNAQILRYEFNEGEGTNAASSGVLSDPLTFKDKLGATTAELWGHPGSGPSGLMLDRALNLTGAEGMGVRFSGPHASLDSLSPAGALEQFTITGWFRPLTQDLDRANLLTIRNGQFELGIVGLSGGIPPGARNRLRLLIYDGQGLSEVDANGGFEPLWSTPGGWGFFAITYASLSETNRVTFYSGGVTTPAALSIPSMPSMSRLGTVQFPLENSAIWIGSTPSNTDPFKGYMDDIRVYDTALGLSEVEEVRLSGVPGPGLIDFRNFVPGLVDAPVYRADGTNRLSGTIYLAQLFAGQDEYSLVPWGAPLNFKEGELAGYWDDCCDPSVYTRPVPFAPGQRIAIQVRAWEQSGGWIEVMPPPRLQGESSVFYLTLLDSPTPLLGLESFSLRAAPIREIFAVGDQVVIRWSAGNGWAHYEVETTSGFEEPVVWSKLPIEPTLVGGSDWILTNQVTAPAAFYRIRLLDP